MEKIKQTYRELLYLNSGVDAGLVLNGAKYNFATVKTQRLFAGDVKDINAANNLSKEFQEYQQKLFELMKPLAIMEKGKAGEEQPVPVISNGEVFLKIKPENEKEFSSKLEALRKKYAVEIKKRDEQKVVYEEMLNEVVEIELHKIKSDDLPENITLGHVDGIMPLLEPIKAADKIMVKFTNLYIIRYRQFFLSVFSLSKKDVVVGMIENLRDLSRIREELLTSKIYIDYFKVYDKPRIKLCESYANTDIYGGAKVIGNDYDIPKLAEFNSELDKLRKKYKKIIDAYEECMNKEVELSMNVVPFEALPEDISGEQMQVIADFVK